MNDNNRTRSNRNIFDVKHLEEQVDEGHLLLFVRVNDPEEEAKAVGILSRHGGYDARVHEVKIR